MTQDINLKSPPEPSELEVRKSIDKRKRLFNYEKQEESLEKLFTKTYRENKKIEDVLIKVCTLNEFYSTYMHKPFIVAIAKHIVDLDIDTRVRSGCHTIVNKIGKRITAMSKDVITEEGTKKEQKNYSFATKYCSFHCPNRYPICDSYVKKTLFHFHDNDKNEGFLNFLNENNKNKKLTYNKFGEEIQCYHQFYKAINTFKGHYGIEKFNVKEIDTYLWLTGQHLSRLKKQEKEKEAKKQAAANNKK